MDINNIKQTMTIDEYIEYMGNDEYIERIAVDVQTKFRQYEWVKAVAVTGKTYKKDGVLHVEAIRIERPENL